MSKPKDFEPRCEARCNRTKAQHTNPVAHAFRTAEEEARENRLRSEPSSNARARDVAVVLLKSALSTNWNVPGTVSYTHLTLPTTERV